MSCILQEIYCTTDSWQTVWQDAPLTACPIDSNHTVGDTRVQYVARLVSHVDIDRTLTNTSYTNIGGFRVQGEDYWSIDAPRPKYLKIRSKVSLGNYAIRVIDDSSTTLFEATGLSDTSFTDTVFDFETVSLPSSPTVYTIQALASAGTITFQCAELYFKRVTE